MAKLFLSYSRKDAGRAERFTQWLEREGHDVWRDDDDIGGGASFSTEIEKALIDCEAVLVLWSADSVKSAWVRDEAGFGRDKGKLIPLSLDGTEPPLGFRQFQAIDLSKWRGRGDPPAAARIRTAIERVSGSSATVAQATAVPRWRVASVRDLPRSASIAFGILAVAALALGLFLWQGSAADRNIVIAVSPSPTSPDRAMAADYADVAAADMAVFLGTHFERATVIAPADAGSRTSRYRVLISATRQGNVADASVTISDADGHTIIWSKSWTVPDVSAVDLREEVSRFASNAALCLTDAKGGSERLSQPALGVYMAGCTGVNDSDWSDAQRLAAFERVVKLAPDFPPGWASLSVARAIWTSEQKGSPDYPAAVQSARQAIAEARRLNPRSGLPYVAEFHLVELNSLPALQALEQGAKVDPDNSVVQMDRADALESVGRMSDSVEAAQRADDLDPLSPFTRSHYILALTYAGAFSQAKAALSDARKKWRNDPQIDWAEFGYQYRYGDPRVAMQLLPKITNLTDAEMLPLRKLIAARLDPTPAKVEDALATFRAGTLSSPPSHNILLLALGTFGKTEEAYQLLDDPKFQPFVSTDILFRPEFAPVRADPRFMPLAARLGLVRYWRRSGNWPDFCVTEQLPYDCKKEAAKYAS